MREVSGSAVYYQDSRYLEITVIFEDENSYLIDEIDETAVQPLNAAGYPLLPVPMVLTNMHGNLSNTEGDQLVSLRSSVANIDAPSKIAVRLKDTDGVVYNLEIIPQFRDRRVEQIGPNINEDEIIKP